MKVSRSADLTTLCYFASPDTALTPASTKSALLSYYDPKEGTEVSTLFNQEIWISGYDAGGALHLSDDSYGSYSGQYDYYPGPLEPDGSLAYGCEGFRQIWSVTQADILAHLADYSDDGTVDVFIPAIMGWPARGEPVFRHLS